MKTQQAIEKAGSAADLARLLGITQSAVCQWGEDVPERRVWQLKVLRPGWFRAKKAAATQAQEVAHG